MSIAYGFTIVDNHFSHKKKSVSFCDEVKEYDGCSDFNRNFARLCHFYFNPKSKLKIIHSFDVIDFINIVKDDINNTPRSFIEQCLEEFQITKVKLLDLKRQEKILQICAFFAKQRTNASHPPTTVWPSSGQVPSLLSLHC